ncbi:MAG: hypothetical protein MI754_02415 [Chromatiales bacterium]|nr:hypothetical protein [Chromatiales bacterium]
MWDKKIKVAIFIMLCVLAAVYLYAMTLGSIERDVFLKEAGVVEFTTAVGYLLCALLILYEGKLQYLRKYHYFFLIIVLFGLRELDFHKQFTSMSILKSRFYLSSDVPVMEKVIGLLVILLLIYIVYSIIKNHFSRFIADLKKRSIVAIGAANAILFLVVSKVMDGLERKLKPVGVELSDRLGEYVFALEEILELGIPYILMLTFYAYFKLEPVNTNLSTPVESKKT